MVQAGKVAAILAAGLGSSALISGAARARTIGVSPDAEFVFSPTAPKVGETVVFDASGSSDPDGVITRYQWAFGDGSTGSGVTATHVYGTAGDFTVTLAVTDDDGNTTRAVGFPRVGEENPEGFYGGGVFGGNGYGGLPDNTTEIGGVV